MISITQVGSLYNISFKYDPELVEMVKKVPGRSWNPIGKYWTIEKNKLGFFMNQIMGTRFESQVNLQSNEDIGKNDTLDKTTHIPDIDISNVPFYVKNGSKPYKHQIDFMKYAIDRQQRGYRSGFLCADEPGLGKAFTLDTIIPSPNGDRKIRDVHVGDYVFGSNGKPTKVTGEYYHNELNMFKVTFSDKTSVTCCEDHLWGFYFSNNYYTAPLSEILSGEFRKRRDSRYSYRELYIPRCRPVEYSSSYKKFISPWLLGFLIGDGSISSGDSAGFTTSYSSILNEVKTNLQEGYELTRNGDISYLIVKQNGPDSLRTLGYLVYCPEDNMYFDSMQAASRHYCYDIRHTAIEKSDHYCRNINKHIFVVDDNHRNNQYVSELRSLGLLGCKAKDKRIPDEYKYCSAKERIEILQGLMDSDGYAGKENFHCYDTMSKQLAEDVAWIVRSLGGLAVINSYKAKLNGKYMGDGYSVTIRMDDPRQIYKASKRKLRASKRKFRPRKRFISIEYLGKMPGKCISVEATDHLYLCSDFTVTHNTIESINLAMFNRNYNNFNHCLIICNINTSKYNWEQEVSEHTNGKMFGYLLGSRMKKKRGTKKKRRVVCGTKEKYEDLMTMHRYGDENEPELPYFIIMNVEALRMKEGKRYPITERLIEMINSGFINMIVIDEIHKNMSPTSIQGKQILKIKDKTGSRCIWLPLTGTPIVNKPTDVFLPMKLVDAHNFSSYYKWCQEFCVYGGYGDVEIVAYKNIPRMKIMLQQNMIRRLKKDVLDLPDKIHFDIFVENTKYQEKLADEVTAELYAHAGEISNSINPMVKFLKLRQVNGSPELVDQSLKVNSQYIKYNAKLQKLFELLEEIHDRGEKVVIFSNWVEPLRTLYRFVSTKYKVCCFTGTMSEAERQKHKRVFLTNPEYTVMVGTIGALGTTHTLTSANNVIFYDEPWTYTDKLQAEDRCHRVGTNSSVNIYTLLSKDTVDERVHDIVYGKKDVAGYIVDNKLDFRNNPDLVYRLLGKDKE